jgi:hypothetical protein
MRYRLLMRRGAAAAAATSRGSGLVLAVLGRIRVSGWWDRVLTPDLAVPALRDALTAADVAKDLARSAIRVTMGIEMRACTISVRLTHVPAPVTIRRHDSPFGLPRYEVKVAHARTWIRSLPESAA